MAEFDNRTEWYQSICYTALDQPLQRLSDDQEEKLIEELITLFQACEKYADISKVEGSDKDEVFSFDMVAKDGTIIRSQTYRLMDKDMKKAERLEMSINHLLQGYDDIAVSTLLRIVKERTSK